MNEDNDVIIEDVFKDDTNQSQSTSQIVSTSVDSEEKAYEEKERQLTKSFLEGKLSFTEYACQMDETVDDAYEESSASTSANVKKQDAKPKQIKRRVKRTLPATLKGLVGEANLRYARGDHKTAEKMCLEVIRQIPTAPEPYQTLAHIYEKKNREKSLQFDLIAAHLSPNDEDQWLRLAKMSETFGNSKQADTCYAKAILCNPSNIDLHLKRIQFLETLGDTRLLQKAKYRSLNYMKAEHHEILIPIAKELTKKYYEDKDIAKARDSLNFIFTKCPECITPELVNMMLEILLILKEYKKCLEILVQYCNIDVEIETHMFNIDSGEVEEKINVLSYHVPQTMQIDLHIKFIVCLVHLHAFELIDPLIAALLAEEEDVEKNGDLYLDVAEALMEENHHKDALKLLVPLVKSNNFGMPAVWLRHAECLNACELYEQAIDSYKTVMRLQPEHLEVRYPLSDLLIKLNRKREALAVLEQDENYEEIDPGLLFKRCKLLRELKMYSKFWSAGLLLLSRHCYNIRNRDEVFRITAMQMPDKKGGALKTLRTELGEDPNDAKAMFTESDKLSVDEEFCLFKDMIDICMKRRRYDLMQRISFTALTSKRFKEYKDHVEIIATYACLFNEDSYHGYNLIRDIIQHKLDSRKHWNLYNLMIQKSDDCRHNRFLMRLLARANVDVHLHILHANNCLVAGTYKYALSEYVELYRLKEDPMLAFLIGVTLFQMASQKFYAKKNYLVVQGVGFLNLYKKLRGPDGLQEANYNIGRGYHQLGMLHIAAHYYKTVLKTKTTMTEKYPQLFDLKREAAFNLHLIYKNSGSYDLAKMYLYKYIII